MKVTDIYPQLQALVDNIQVLSAEYGYTNKELARICGISTKTLQRRLESPWEFSIIELLNISKIWNTTLNELTERN